jgi:hypothetical protein
MHFRISVVLLSKFSTATACVYDRSRCRKANGFDYLATFLDELFEAMSNRFILIFGIAAVRGVGLVKKNSSIVRKSGQKLHHSLRWPLCRARSFMLMLACPKISLAIARSGTHPIC